MSKRISILHFLSNYIIVLLPIFTLCVMGPTEIYFGNYKELGFTYQEFGWKFLFFSFLITTLLTLILSFLPDKIQKYFLSVIYWIGIAGYLQTMFLNKQLDLMGVSAESYSATRMKTVLNACLWFVLLVLILFFTMYPKTKMHKILSITSGIIFGMQLVGFLSLFPTADEAAFSYPTEELCLDGSEQYTISSKENIILFVLDNFAIDYYTSAVQTYPELTDQLKDFTYYSNADCNYHGTYPSLAHLITGNELDPSLTVDDWLTQCWTNDITNDYFSLLESEDYKVNLYTPVTSILTGTNSLELLDDKINNVTYKSNTRMIDYSKLYKTMLYMSCYRFMPEYFKPAFDVKNETYTSIVSYPENAVQHANYDFYSNLLSTGLTLDNSCNYFTIQHLNGTHEFTTNEFCEYDEQNLSCESTVKGIFTMLNVYIEQLKKLGAYDNSTIIITSDHGTIDRPQMIFFIKEKNETHEMMQETSAPITLNELVPTIVESLGKDYSEFGSSIHDFNDGELRERTVYIRDFDESKPPVPCYDGLRDGKVNAYRVYTYTGGEAEFVNALYGDDIITIPMVDSYF